jgi:hypothetical protein
VAYAPATRAIALCSDGTINLYDLDLREPEEKDRELLCRKPCFYGQLLTYNGM